MDNECVRHRTIVEIDFKKLAWFHYRVVHRSLSN